MLPKAKIAREYHLSLIVIIISVLIVILGTQSSRAIHNPASEIIEPPRGYPTVTGFQNITVYDENAKKMDLYLYIDPENPENEPCYTIARGLEFNTSTHKITYSWDSTT